MDQLLAVLRAAGERTRLRLLALLQHNELAVNEIGRIVGQSQPRVSRHLKLLCEAGLLERFQEGAWVFYRLAEHGPNAALVHTIAGLIPAEDPELLRDCERLEAVTRERADQAERYFGKVASRWDEIRGLHVDDASIEAAILEAAGSTPIQDFLDLGTGTGRILELFADRVQQGSGVDMSREMLVVARNRLERSGLRNCRVRQGNIYQLDLPAASVDLITIHHVLHFLDRPGEALAEAARLLRPGGRLITADFGPHDIEMLRAEHAHRRLGFTDAEIEGWYADAGLTNVEIRYLTAQEGDADRPLTTAIWTATRSAAEVLPFDREHRQ
ncbi:MAG: metalloregulator ArsR/SmtB family transcription factor [Pseudomonadota bacterium]